MTKARSNDLAVEGRIWRPHFRDIGGRGVATGSSESGWSKAQARGEKGVEGKAVRLTDWL